MLHDVKVRYIVAHRDTANFVELHHVISCNIMHSDVQVGLLLFVLASLF
jgi:hypothetical protein